MSYPLSVCSSPNSVIPYDPSLDEVDVRVVVFASSSTKRPCPVAGAIKSLFSKDDVRPSAEVEFPRRNSESSMRPRESIRDPKSRQGSHRYSIHFPAPSQQDDGTSHHHKHHRSRSQASPVQRHGPHWTDVNDPWTAELHHHRSPKSTKESIANLGLSQCTFSHSCSHYPSATPMVSFCCESNWFELPVLPPLPRLPPPKKDDLPEITFRSPSSLSNASNVSFEIEAESPIHKDASDEFSEDYSEPPSPILFSKRTSSYVAAASIEDQNKTEIATDKMPFPFSFSSSSGNRPRQLSLPSPSPSPLPSRCSPAMPARQRTVTPSPATIEMMGHFRAFPINTSVLFAPTYKPPKPKRKDSSTSSGSSSSPLKSSPKRAVWKRFNRRHSISSIDQSTPSATSTAIPSQSSRCSIAPAKSSETLGSTDTFGCTSSFSPSNVSGRTMIEQRAASPPTDRNPGKEKEHSRIIRHAHGGVWEEKDVDEVIATLRTMKVSGRITPKFKG